MNCPQCGKEMNNESYWHSGGIGCWDEDGLNYYRELHRCHTCNISFNNGDWSVPEQFEPTYKQLKTVKFICNVLHVGEPAPIKKNICKFINQWLDYAINEVTLQHRYEYDDLSYDYEEEHF